MERKKALAVSAVAALLVVAMATMAVALVRMSTQTNGTAAAMPSGLVPPSSTSLSSPSEPAVEYQDVYDLGDPTADRTGPNEPVAVTSDQREQTGPAPSAPEPSPAPVPAASDPVTPPVHPTTTTAPPPPKVTTSTLPPGVPADWPLGKPIPPMPPGCQKPQLEDNGVWNCDH